ncbi:mandelate racemase/muconate lactonizing enzyme family protein [Rubellimicrobium sp. CFH 75288]|uniref:mandelate racemase/muconate lactonizing enzyme family protein n=1 Tax=Rubellimicrobium sp. CFH 75288 TaxID=2697034 RepID=UPI001412116E|nr:mandelate racemase/muconate lactonizing enzyme family protein [Rubellimicrobium sp. CFH 75288]NAZ38299.1 mandelate racemase/muconate lactonizing enzyme family protein [Rubellimicrobium sp. CFH 75288]
MTVRSVEAIPVSYPEPNDHARHRSVCLVRIQTEEGAVGWGECCAYFPEASRAAKALVEGLAPLVIGQDEVQTERIWHALREHSWWYGTGAGIASLAISGIDIALWDLKGKVLGRSVLDLLGGPVHDRMPAVASVHATRSSIGAMVEEFQGYLADGMQGIKIGFGKKGEAHLGFDHDRDVEFVRRVREGIGPKRLMIDLGVRNFWDVPTAIRRARAFEPFAVHWLEEPLGHDDPEGYRALRAATSLRLAYGEREWNHRGVQRIVESGTVDVVGLDPGRIEGITGFRKAAELCALHRRQANAHNFSTAIVSAASQALSFASPACRELELQPVYGPAQADLVDRPVWHTDGWVHRPEGPGLGIAVNEDLVNRARLDR